MKNIYVTGDIHGNSVRRFSFKSNPLLRDLDNTDIMIILGDCGLPFGIKAPYYDIKIDKYQLNFMKDKKWIFLCLAGNHDDRCAINKMPKVKLFGGEVRQMTLNNQQYDNIYYIDTPQILDIYGNRCLFIPGAESHDINDGILDPKDPDYLSKKLELKKNNKYFFRTKNYDWWEDEVVNPLLLDKLLNNVNNKNFDFIFSHDYPAIVCKSIYVFSRLTQKPTNSELYLEKVRNNVNFDCWLFGHLHEDLYIDENDDRLCCLYKTILKIC